MRKTDVIQFCRIYTVFLCFLAFGGVTAYANEPESRPQSHAPAHVTAWSVFTLAKKNKITEREEDRLVLLSGDQYGGLIMTDIETGATLKNYRDAIKRQDIYAGPFQPRVINAIRLSPDQELICYSVTEKAFEIEHDDSCVFSCRPYVLYVLNATDGSLLARIRWEPPDNDSGILSFGFRDEKISSLNILEMYAASSQKVFRQFYCFDNCELKKDGPDMEMLQKVSTGDFEYCQPEAFGNDYKDDSTLFIDIAWLLRSHKLVRFYRNHPGFDGNLFENEEFCLDLNKTTIFTNWNSKHTDVDQSANDSDFELLNDLLPLPSSVQQVEK